MAKPFAWSYSKMKNFEVCPKKHYEVDLAKNHSEGESEQLLWGNQVHKALADACAGKAKLTLEMSGYQKWVDRVHSFGDIKVEQKYAISKDFQPVSWFSPAAWYRGIADVVVHSGPVAVAIDWKTGKVLEDHSQLTLLAQCLFSHMPALKKIKTEYVWLAHDTTSTSAFTRDDVSAEWPNLLSRLKPMEHAYNTQSYPPKPGKLCRAWCPVTSCVHHGKAVRG